MKSLIERCTLKKNSSGPGEPELVECELAFIGENYLQNLLELQEKITQSLPDKDLFRISSENILKNLFVTERSFIGAFIEDNLAAYSIISFPGESSENLGADIGLSGDELKRAAHLKAVAVHPEYRGNSLQSKMIDLHLAVLQDMGYEHVCSTVSPKNFFSLKNFFSKGFVIRGLKVKYGSMLRYIMHKNLTIPSGHGQEDLKIIETPKMEISKISEKLSINSQNIKRQLELLDGGFIGLGAEGNADAFELIYMLS